MPPQTSENAEYIHVCPDSDDTLDAELGQEVRWCHMYLCIYV